MLTTLLLAAVASPSAGCFNGGALVGVQGGFSHIMLKRLAKDKPFKKEDADKAFDFLYNGIAEINNWTAADAITTSTTVDAQGVASLVVDITGVDLTQGDKALDAIETAVESEAAKLWNLSDAAKIKSFGKVTLKTKDSTMTTKVTAELGKQTIKDKIKKGTDAVLKNKDDTVKQRVASDGEIKYTSNNGFAGIHVGYLGRVNENFLVGGLVEGNWVFGGDIKDKDSSTTRKDTAARFNANIFLRAMFNLTEKFMAGVDLGVSLQEIRTLKEVGKTDKESNWFWGPAARLVLGVALTENILATAHFGGVLPIKQDSFKTEKDTKMKYSNFHGGVGISYAFGG